MKAHRFLFDRNFASIDVSEEEIEEPEEQIEPEVPMMPVADHEALITAAEQAAFERGRAARAAEDHESEEMRLAAETTRLAGEISALFGQLDMERDRQEKDAVALAFLVARRICAHLIAREPLGEIVALISECLGPLRKSPHLVIRVRDGDLEPLKERVDPLVREKGFEGRVVFLAEPELGVGDCRIEWADGGIVRDRRAIEKQIDQAAKRYFEGRKATQKPNATPRQEAADQRSAE